MNEELDDMQCVICHELFERPTTLFCGHTYCMGCIFDYIEANPSCPICKAFVSNTNLKVNISIQKLIEKHRRKETARQNLSSLRVGSSSREIKKISYKLCEKDKFFYPSTNVEVKIEFLGSRSELNNLVLNADFVGISAVEEKAGYLFTALRILDFEKGVATLFCQCKQRLDVLEVMSMEVNIGDALSRVMVISHIATCKRKEAEGSSPEEDELKKLEIVEQKIVFFLKIIKDKNPEVYNHLKKKCSFTLTDQLSIDYKDNPVKFLELVCAMLKLPLRLQKQFCETCQWSTKLDIIYNYVDRLETSQDPIFFFEGEGGSNFTGGIFYFFCALFLIIIINSILRD